MNTPDILNNKTILLTGGTGYLGSHLLSKLAESNIKLIVLKRKNSNAERLQKFSNRLVIYNIEDYDISQLVKNDLPDVIVNCATNYANDLKNITNTMEANLILPLKLLESILYCDKKIIFINTDTILDRRINAYSLSKKQFSDWGKFASKQLLFVNAILDYFYGPHDQRFKFYTKLITDLLLGVSEINLTTGDQTRNFTYIDDVTDALVRIIKYTISLTAANGFYAFEIGSRETVTMKKFILLIKKLVGNKVTKLNFGALPYRPYEVMNYKLKSDAIQKLGWQPKYNLQQGLTKTIVAERENLLKRSD